MTILKSSFILGVLAASIATPVSIRHGTQARLQEKLASVQQQAAQVDELSAENRRLSDQLAATIRVPALKAEEQSELLRLRGQIGQLRRSARQAENLRDRNRKLAAAASASAAAAQHKPQVNVQSTADYWVKDQLAYSGYNSPEESLKTAFWAAHTGDARTMLECMTPEARAGMEREWQKDGKSEADAAEELKAMGASLAAPSDAFRLLDEQTKSPDEMVANISFEGEGKARKFVLRKVGNEWKIERMLFAGEEP